PRERAFARRERLADGKPASSGTGGLRERARDLVVGSRLHRHVAGSVLPGFRRDFFDEARVEVVLVLHLRLVHFVLGEERVDRLARTVNGLEPVALLPGLQVALEVEEAR